MTGQPLIDPFGRRVTYLRVSVTDRCDFRCIYCMAETMTFLPRQDLLTLEEIDRLASAFVAQGVRKLRLTGGEPLVRRNIMWLVERLSRHFGGGLDELTLTTNGSQLALHAEALAACGVARINVSLDTLDASKFRVITRRGDLAQVLRGIEAASRAGLKIKINTVGLRGVNEDEIEDLIRWAHGSGFDLTLIETMPMGEIDADRTEQYLPLSLVRARLGQHFTLDEIDYNSGGPARYVTLRGDGRQARLHHTHDPQFLRGLQSRACHLHGHTLYVPWTGGRRRSARAPSGQARTMPSFTRPSTLPLRGSPRATTSSSTGENGRPWAAHVDDRRVRSGESQRSRHFFRRPPIRPTLPGMLC